LGWWATAEAAVVVGATVEAAAGTIGGWPVPGPLGLAPLARIKYELFTTFIRDPENPANIEHCGSDEIVGVFRQITSSPMGKCEMRTKICPSAHLLFRWYILRKKLKRKKQ
jgi:hypothetical protein